uniref:Uncharacterized protein n=1 Tax=Onchocerca volvulus TaxID=6282 RepID=A0A8R1TLA7_ONCVO
MKIKTLTVITYHLIPNLFYKVYAKELQRRYGKSTESYKAMKMEKKQFHLNKLSLLVNTKGGILRIKYRSKTIKIN